MILLTSSCLGVVVWESQTSFGAVIRLLGLRANKHCQYFSFFSPPPLSAFVIPCAVFWRNILSPLSAAIMHSFYNHLLFKGIDKHRGKQLAIQLFCYEKLGSYQVKS